MKTILETYQFDGLAELRDWLNLFEKTDLSTVYFEDKEGAPLPFLNVGWVEETLSDGSKVNQLRICNA